jgi:hypothetical protein
VARHRSAEGVGGSSVALAGIEQGAENLRRPRRVGTPARYSMNRPVSFGVLFPLGSLVRGPCADSWCSRTGITMFFIGVALTVTLGFASHVTSLPRKPANVPALWCPTLQPHRTRSTPGRHKVLSFFLTRSYTSCFG